MAHNLEVKDGNASFFTVKSLAWHGLGTVLENCPTSKEAIEIAHMDYEVKKAEVYAKFSDIGTPEQRGRKIDNTFAIYRDDNKHIFTQGGNLVTNIYEIVQNKEAFTFFDSIVGEGAAIYETAGVLGNGETIFITAKLPEATVICNTDIVNNYLLLTMGHDGTASIQCMFTPIRVVCNNTLNMALRNNSNKVRIRHTNSAHDKLAYAHEIMGISKKCVEANKELISRLIEAKVNDKQITDYVNFMFLNPNELSQLAMNGSHERAGISTKKINNISRVLEYYDRGIGQGFDYTQGTAFGLYSAITGFTQNVKTYTTNGEESLSKKMYDCYLGSSYDFGQKALNKILELV